MKPEEKKEIITVILGLIVGLLSSEAFAQGTWETKAPMPTGVSGAAGDVIGGKLYIVGGSPPEGFATKKLQVYDPGTDLWTLKQEAGLSRAHAAAGAIGGKLYVVGGCLNSDCSFPTNQLEVYDSATNTWETKAPMPTTRFAAAAAAIDGKLYVVGGASSFVGSNLSTLEVYDPGLNTWATKVSMPTNREELRVAEIDGKLYAVGGFVRPSNVWTNTLEVYDPLTDTWETKAPMPTARASFALGVINGQLHAVGGANAGGFVVTLEVYDPSTDTWTDTGADIPTPRARLVAGVINAKLYVPGGLICPPSTSCTATDVLEVFTSEITVAIDIKPGSFPNSINPRSIGVIPAAILTTGTFDAATVHPTTVRFGKAGTEVPPLRSGLEDVDGDGDTDMILHFDAQSTGIVCGDTSASLTGKTFTAQPIKGSDSIKTVECR